MPQGTITERFQVGDDDMDLAFYYRAGQAVGGGLLDVLVVFDTSISMGGEMDQIAANFSAEVVPEVLSTRPGAAFGVAGYGAPGDRRPVRLVTPITTSVDDAQAGFNYMSTWGGGTEIGYEALYQMASGVGLDGRHAFDLVAGPVDGHSAPTRRDM